MSNSSSENSILLRLQILLEDHQAYLESTITAQTICKILGCNPRDLPRMVKNEYGFGINRLINQYRVRHAVQLIEEEYLKNRTVESLALEVGFRSRNTFYLAFKKETGLSPSIFNNSVIDLDWIGLLPR